MYISEKKKLVNILLYKLCGNGNTSWSNKCDDCCVKLRSSRKVVRQPCLTLVEWCCADQLCLLKVAEKGASVNF